MVEKSGVAARMLCSYSRKFQANTLFLIMVQWCYVQLFQSETSCVLSLATTSLHAWFSLLLIHF